PEPLPESVATRYGIVPPYILYVGNFRPHKNLPRLIRAYANLRKSLRDTYQLILAGGDREHRQALEGLVRDLGIIDRVLFPGVIEDSHLRQCIAPARCLCFHHLKRASDCRHWRPWHAGLLWSQG